jgi:predicted MFS family arabinose efflux permease
VGATTFALQSANVGSKELSLGLSRASTSIGQTIGPLLCGAMIEAMGYTSGFQAMALISLIVFLMVWAGLTRHGPESA